MGGATIGLLALGAGGLALRSAANAEGSQQQKVNSGIASTATPRPTDAAGTPTPNTLNAPTQGYQLMADYDLSHGQCVTVDQGPNVVTLIEGDVLVGPAGTPRSSLRRAYDSKQQTGLIVEATGPVEVCAPYGADVQVVGSDLDAVGYFEGQDIEGFKADGCGLPNGCSVVDVIKATNGVLAATQGN